LAHNHVNRIVRDSHGFLWFCTAGGLSRFDGYEFKNFGTDQGLPHSSVTDLLETRSGQYWVATGGGLALFNPRGIPNRVVVYDSATTSVTAMFTVVLPDSQNKQADGINVLLEGHDNTIWAGTNGGLYRLEGAMGRHSLRPVEASIPKEFPEQRMVADLLEDRSGSLWIAAPSGLFRRWPDGSSARYTRDDGLPSDYVHTLLEDHEGHLWVGTLLHFFFRVKFDASHAAPTVDVNFSSSKEYEYSFPSAWVFRLFEGSDHRFWVATARGLLEFFPHARDPDQFHTYASRNGLTDYNITALAEDLSGNLWLGTFSAGAMKLTRGGFSSYGKQDGIETLNAIFEDRKGRLCFRGNVLGDARTSVFEGAKLDLLRGDQPSIHSRIGCLDARRFDWYYPGAVTRSMGWVTENVTLQTRNGEWWMGTGEGVFRFPASTSFLSLKTAKPLAVYKLADGLANLQVFRLFEDSRGNVWISTTGSAQNGLARWEPGDARVHNLAGSPGLPSLEKDLPLSFGEDRHRNVWIGFGNGLARYSNGVFTYFGSGSNFQPGAINDIHLDRSKRLWLASDRAGLVRVDNENAPRPAFVNHTTAQGLASNNTEVIGEDLFGRLYIGGGRGLDRFDAATGRVRHFTTADGLAAGMFRAAFRDHDGVLWFGMTSGLSRLVPTIEKQPAPPPVLITALRVSGVTRPISAVGERKMSLPDFASEQNNLEIDFVGLGFASGDVLRYQYKLDGADGNWSALSAQRTVSYASLSPGTYKFEVRAVTSDGIASDDPASVAFAILTPIWFRWWFLTLVGLITGLIAYSLYRYRVTRLVEMANIRTRIATDLHDDIGANLTRIALLSEVANQARAVDSNSDDDVRLSSITRIARESVSSMSDIVWAINPHRESVLDLTRRMRQHADEIFTLRDIGLRFAVPASTDGLKLEMDVRRDLLLIFKEAVNNAARHSLCSHVNIELRVEASRLLLSVIDDGVGFNESTGRDGQGLASMHRRAQRLGGQLDVTSVSGVGTTVRLEIPL
jgi:ligand-binding sensor domain-containing protein/two-component sensor histidine kinase